MVRMFQPHTLLSAFGIAKMQEENVAALRRVSRLGLGSSKAPLGLPAPENRVVVSMQRLYLS